MPAAGTRYERAAVHGGMDSTYFSQSNAGNAHMIREVARNSNRIHSVGMPILSLQWRADGDPATDRDGIMADYVTWPAWQRIFPAPIPCPHQPQLRSAHVDVWANISNGQSVYLQIGTSAKPFNAASTHLTEPNVFTMAGAGVMTAYTYSGLPLGPDPIEAIEIGLVGTSGAVADAADIITNSGTVTNVRERYVFDSAATYGGTLIAPGRAVGFWIGMFDTNGGYLSFRRIVSATAFELYIDPPFTAEEMPLHIGASYTIYVSSQWRMNSLVITEEDDDAV